VASLAFWPFFKSVDEQILKAGLDIGFWAAIGELFILPQYTHVSLGRVGWLLTNITQPCACYLS